jgi:hypothetical protein
MPATSISCARLSMVAPATETRRHTHQGRFEALDDDVDGAKYRWLANRFAQLVPRRAGP